MTREIIFMMIAGNPNIDANKKPKSKSEIFKLEIDQVEPAKKKIKRLTAQDIKVYEQLEFSKNGISK